jgi:hypothetical protein
MTTEAMAREFQERLKKDAEDLQEWIEDKESLEVNEGVSFLTYRRRVERLKAAAEVLDTLFKTW